MARVAVQEAGQASVETTAHGIKILIKPKKRIFILFFVTFWLVFWTFGGVQAFGELVNPQTDDAGRLFMAFWLCGWLAGELFALLVVCWALAGKETITIGSGALVHRREIWGKGITKEYDTKHIKNLRISSSGVFGNMNGFEYWGIGGGTISFDYGVKTYKVGSVEEAEANQLIHVIQKNLGTGAISA